MGSERAFIKARQGRIDLESKVGKTQIVASVDAVGSAAAGWWCEVCDCLLKDSVSYLDHINGKKRKHIRCFTLIANV
jgi:U4/U6.U5 tri-snRNP component SNU23